MIKSLDAPIPEELADVGAVYLDAPSGRFVERFRDIVRFERGPGIPQIGRFGSRPMLEELASLTLPPTDVGTLRTCRPGDCDVKLSVAAMRGSGTKWIGHRQTRRAGRRRCPQDAREVPAPQRTESDP